LSQPNEVRCITIEQINLATSFPRFGIVLSPFSSYTSDGGLAAPQYFSSVERMLIDLGDSPAALGALSGSFSNSFEGHTFWFTWALIETTDSRGDYPFTAVAIDRPQPSEVLDFSLPFTIVAAGVYESSTDTWIPSPSLTGVRANYADVVGDLCLSYSVYKSLVFTPFWVCPLDSYSIWHLNFTAQFDQPFRVARSDGHGVYFPDDISIDGANNLVFTQLMKYVPGFS